MASKFTNTQPVIRELEVSPGKWLKVTFSASGISAIRKGDKSKQKKEIKLTWDEVFQVDEIEFLFEQASKAKSVEAETVTEDQPAS